MLKRRRLPRLVLGLVMLQVHGQFQGSDGHFSASDHVPLGKWTELASELARSPETLPDSARMLVPSFLNLIQLLRILNRVLLSCCSVFWCHLLPARRTTHSFNTTCTCPANPPYTSVQISSFIIRFFSSLYQYIQIVKHLSNTGLLAIQSP